MEKDLVSIITPVYNSENVLEQTIESVFVQTYKNWELILVDDFSKDNSRYIIEKWRKKDNRIKSILLSKNSGAGNARNVGLDSSKGNYIAFLDADDIWLSDKLMDQLNFFKNNSGIKFQYSWYYTIDEKNNPLYAYRTPKKVSFNLLRFNNYILTSTVICETQLVKGSKFSEIRKRQDWSFFLTLLKKSNYAYAIPKMTVKYRKMPNTLSSNRWKLIKPNFIFFRDFLYNGNSFLAVLHFIVFLPYYFHNKTFNKKSIKD
ncbi:teichuronic acid biosynthesis glycosyltransferase TuaG [Ekhidna lutea]|uniref:Teichuronic acid biosynthesis glycosyltransferase TuaG n=1 Tax=Ekhidna lutea TaxID=447679 RepID=A0A239FHS3_EKHLU|nr:glycosyltransferase family 2 protein [Ekhidna lutea]SNS56476.1 teichuronic acid biosynthesis glycosyltransferase TuaG [Ekhidna lutea]